MNHSDSFRGAEKQERETREADASRETRRRLTYTLWNQFPNETPQQEVDKVSLPLNQEKATSQTFKRQSGLRGN